MKKETSCGCIIFDRETKSKVLVVYEKGRNFWGFPKGHIEEGENEFQTALREVKEEVGLDVDIVDSKYRYEMNYIIEDKQVDKTTVLYLAFTKNNENDVTNQEEEIAESRWLSVEEALKVLSYDNVKQALMQAWNDLQKIIQ